MQVVRPKPATVYRLWKKGYNITRISQELNLHRSTVSRYLDKAGVPPRRGGINRADTCDKGHSMADAYEVKGGGRACRPCKKERAHAWYHNQMLMKAIAEMNVESVNEC